MPPFKSLRRRIVVAYLLFAAVASLFFAIIAAVAVEGIEVKLVDERLEEVAAWASPRQAGGLPVEMPAGLSFFHDAEIPQSLRGLPQGANEITVDGVDLHVLAGRDAAGDYVVVDHASAYEKIELVVYSMFAIGFAGFLVSSLMFGAFIGNSVVRPIMDLATAVQARRTDLPLQDSPDELGILARAFAARTTELTEVLDRERFFTGDVSHELRTPLTVISGAAEVIMAQAPGNPAIQAASERIYRAARDASDSITVLLRLARSPEQLEAAPVSMAALAAEECARSQPLLGAKPLSLRYAGGFDFLVTAPRELMIAAVGNLVRNACLYTLEGEVVVVLQDRSLFVEDTGPGLPPAARARVLHEAAPLGASGSGSSGTGLGLGLVQRICAYLGASLHYSERAGGGSVFEIRFP
ncbi:sensor histidine kinase [Duganella phyllosphaerae]|uniref:histidine kinase n=1 Tax=Duganella phyllosphaerae TaxID=762836 RepID=A0A1E7WM14_9BURK|nr:HAMP domain-containing sensor histidine kinase [Duganella phyllosphaerae]OFA00065.1 signal transduction histidine-protein kinase ArlS [Duganella phyllosphaerae]